MGTQRMPASEVAWGGGRRRKEATLQARQRPQEGRHREDGGSLLKGGATTVLPLAQTVWAGRAAVKAWVGVVGAAPMWGAPALARSGMGWYPLCIELPGEQAARVEPEGWQGIAAGAGGALARRLEKAWLSEPKGGRSAEKGGQRKHGAKKTEGRGTPEKHRSGCHVQRGAGFSSAALGRARAGTMRQGKWLEPNP